MVTEWLMVTDNVPNPYSRVYNKRIIFNMIVVLWRVIIETLCGPLLVKVTLHNKFTY